jgi:hypothetical protein
MDDLLQRVCTLQNNKHLRTHSACGYLFPVLGRFLSIIVTNGEEISFYSSLLTILFDPLAIGQVHLIAFT